MKYDPQKHHRRSIRLKGYDYRNAGAYFVTICTQNRECVLDDPIVNGIINDVWLALPLWFPTIALDEFVVMPNHVHFTVWVGATLAVAQDEVAQARAGAPFTGPSPASTTHDAVAHARAGASRAGASRAGAPFTGLSPAPTMGTGWVIPNPETGNHSPALGDVVGSFKSLVFKVYFDWVEINDPSRRAKFWQRNYYEHIIRNDRELNAIRQYIVDNPINWELDRDNPANLRRLPPPEKVEENLQDVEDMLRMKS